MPPEANGEVLSQGDITLGIWDPLNRVFTPDAAPPNAVRVVTRRSDDAGNPLSLFFGQIFGIADTNVSTTAIAIRGASACVVALKPNGIGISVNSNGQITTENCGIHANSTDTNSITTNAGSSITVAGNATICTAGNYVGVGYSPQPATGCEVQPDPLASLSPPPLGSCDHTEKVVVEGGETETLSPGRYCAGLEINSDSTANFEPGTYIIEGDKFTVNAGATAQGTGVSFYLRDKDALILFNQDSQIVFSAPTSGDMAGVLLYVDRDIGELTQHQINSDTTSQLNGTIYMPESELVINSGDQVGGEGTCTTLVVGNLVVNSDSSFYIGQDMAACGVPSPDGISNRVRLVR